MESKECIKCNKSKTIERKSELQRYEVHSELDGILKNEMLKNTLVNKEVIKNVEKFEVNEINKNN